jgi:hypothetical protein
MSFADQASGLGLKCNLLISMHRLNDAIRRGVAASNLRILSVSAGETFIQSSLAFKGRQWIRPVERTLAAAKYKV